MKSDFANTINTICDSSNLSANACERYGMTWGCDGNCPVFSSGNCKMEDIEAMRDTIKYTHRFDGWTENELNEIYPELEL